MINRGKVFNTKRYWSPYGSTAPTGNLIDVSRYQTDGVITGATWTQTPNGIWYLDIDSATPDYVEIANADQLNFVKSEFSIAIWLKADSLASNPYIVNRSIAATNGYTLWINTTGIVYFSTHQAAANQHTYSSAGDIVVGSWYYICVTRIGASVLIYKNGVDITATAGTHIDPVSNNESCMLGVYRDKTSNRFDGGFGYFDACNYALSQEAINNNFESERSDFGVSV